MKTTANTIRINKSEVMRNAWTIYKTNKDNLSFSECLKLSWYKAKHPVKKLNFDTLYKENYNKIFKVVSFKVRNIDDAKELTNDIFMKVNKYLCIFDTEISKFNTWLYTITQNAIVDYYRATKNQNLNTQISDFVNESGDETLQIIDNSVLNIAENNELNTKLIDTFNNLNEPFKTISKLFFLEQKQYIEIADMLNIPLNTVKVYLMRAKAKLQENLQTEYQSLS